jgi:hypothetical protein
VDQEQDERILTVIGNEKVETDVAIRLWHRHLLANLQLPCEVTGIEDFQWEEFYVVGPGDKAEYEKLRKNCPSYRDVFDLKVIDIDSYSKWSMFAEDLKARVLRKSDGKQFILGLSELKVRKKDSPDYQVLHDYVVWHVNYR